MAESLWPVENSIDLGSGTRYVKSMYTFGDEKRWAGIIEIHLKPNGEECYGSVLFDIPGMREKFPDRELWTVESYDPLTLSPSIHCLGCGHHGFIRSGQWQDA